jgi:F5/8 type C domain
MNPVSQQMHCLNPANIKIAKRSLICLGGVMVLLLSIWTSVPFSLNISQPASAQSSNSCSDISVSTNKVSASGSESGNPHVNTIDNNLNTRWSNLGIGSWVQFDLGASKVVCNIDIAWYRGDLRKVNFEVSVSMDGNTFKEIFSGKSSGTTIYPENYDIPDVVAKYVRITVNGNSENNWASISEVRIKGYSVCTDSPIPANKVSASGSETGNPPSNTLDNSLNTRWSSFGLPSWVRYDLDSSHAVCFLDIAWYRGNLRVYGFTVSVSDDDVSYRDVFRGVSSGSTKSYERYDIPDVNARYVRITVDRNSENDWASISEVKLYGGTSPLPQESCNNNVDDDGDGLIDRADSDCQPTESNIDKFGIIKINPTKKGGEEWYMNMNDPTSDPRTRPPPMTRNSDGSWKVTTTPQVQYRIYTSTGYDQDQISTYNQKELASKGYMQASNDWKNVEMTGYIKANKVSDTRFIWYNRGGTHSSDVPCEGTAYKGNLYYDGRTRFQKEQWHDGGYSSSPIIKATESIVGKWVGFKYVVYNFVKDGKLQVKMENWLDAGNTGNWVKIYELVDSGGWGDEGDHCGGAPDQIMTWGGPNADFRWDQLQSGMPVDVDIRSFSVREIEPPS